MKQKKKAVIDIDDTIWHFCYSSLLGIIPSENSDSLQYEKLTAVALHIKPPSTLG
jgi:hypothetical protein